jgi:LPS-assembly lipoprotein
MSLLDRRTLLMLPLALAACGFTPVHAPGENGARLYDRVAITSPGASAESYLIVRNLEERLGRSQVNAYTLDVSVTTDTQQQAITAANVTTRFSLVGTAKFVLTDTSDGRIVVSGDVQNFTGYSNTGSTVDTLAGEKDARERLMSILADQIVSQILATADLG